MSSAWGDAQTQYFFSLTPDRVLDAVEVSGLRCTGRCFTLNSFENRVYDVELEDGADPDAPPVRRVIKFYRPGRWSEAQILEEHEFLADLRAAEIPAIAPLEFPEGGGTLRRTESGIWYAVFPKIGGRAPDALAESDDETLLRVGRLLARMHAVGVAKPARHRIALTPETYGEANLDFLLQGFLPPDLRARYEHAARGIIAASAPLFARVASKAPRTHGDCHAGNLLLNGQGHFFFLDFDDMVVGPPVQDVWLLLPGRDAESRARREILLEGYAEMRAFDRSSLVLIEPLRALRFIHYAAWIARRWQDPAFPRAFPAFNSHGYWAEQVGDLEEQMRLIGQPDWP